MAVPVLALLAAGVTVGGLAGLTTALTDRSLLAFLERVLPWSARLVWMTTALGSGFVAPLPAPGLDVATRVILGALHVAAAAVLIAAMARTALGAGTDADR
ncbi:DUF6069 family protein [Micromonospora sp. WMMC241]|uniref:DUF6069 family protein n=1 Tax=Micromonospora sp. WMMC241 TaxID=3015159 RepID=UPI0022B6B6BA|nr:DUF6069 family protein [Micromonospora sp. WMMC241]MCZ7436698.1 DUF6069 family protein [Micromonospora sp. WMMC241]